MDKQDKIFKEVARNHTTEVDFDGLWVTLEPHVPKRKNDKKLLWVWMSISGLLIISVLTWYFGIYKSIDSNQGDNSNEMLVGDQSPDIHGKNIDDQLINSTKDAFYTSENSNSSRNSVSRMAQESQNTSNPDFQLHETSVGNPLTKNQQVSTDYYNQYLPNFRFSTIIHVFDEELISDKISDNLGDEKQTNEIFYVDENQDKHIPLSIPSLKSTPFIDLHSIRGEKEITILPARNRWFNLLIYSGIGKTWIKYTNQNDAKLLQKMNQAEVGKEYLNIGLSTEKKIAQRWYINVGLRFGRLVSVIHNTSSIVNPVISQDITEIIIDSLGIERLIYGQKSGYQIMTTTSTWFTYHYQLELPVTVKYSFYSNPRYRVAVLGGFTLPIWMNSTGSYYDVEGIWKKFSESSPFIANKLSWMYGMECEWKFNQNGSIHTSIVNESKKYSLIQPPSKSDKNNSILYFNLGYRHHF